MGFGVCTWRIGRQEQCQGFHLLHGLPGAQHYVCWDGAGGNVLSDERVKKTNRA